MPEKWSEDLAKGAFNLEETDIGSSDQVKEQWIDRQEDLCNSLWEGCRGGEGGVQHGTHVQYTQDCGLPQVGCKVWSMHTRRR